MLGGKIMERDDMLFWIGQKREEYETERRKWKQDSSFYYAFTEKIAVLDDLLDFVIKNLW